MNQSRTDCMEGIAIVGMNGRFPGAETLAAFWENLVGGVESIAQFDLETVPAEEPKQDPDYVPRRGVIDKAEWFDAEFFGMKHREAEGTDPQQRLFLECCWHALEDAGIDPARFPGAIGVYAGAGNNSYFSHQIEFNEELRTALGPEGVMLGNEKDYLATRIAYKLNLRGPAVNIANACSTSLVAVCQAVAALQAFQCDAALAGGVSIKFPQERGYLRQEGAMFSTSGQVRAFDAAADGTVFSNGVGVVVLRRLEDAVRDGDRIYAVIKGAALNNDGSEKASFTAPSVAGHAEVIALAQALANVDPATIGYVEAHGTGTPLGDPIEIAGLTAAFEAGGLTQRNFCALGSVKTNLGHLDAAGGVAGLIKTALMLQHKILPPTLHFTQANPACSLESSPFFVNTTTREWKTANHPRRAGVSSFGLGGTNAHCVLEEFSEVPNSTPGREEQILVLSARTPAALLDLTDAMAKHLEESGDDLADVAWTLQTGRHQFNHRLCVAARSAAGAARKLREHNATEVLTQQQEFADVPVSFLFPGQGSQHLRMGASLHKREPVFRAIVDECSELLHPALGFDLRTLIYPVPGTENETERKLSETRFTQPALFVTEYALAKLLMHFGVRPSMMLGHSIGEYVAACLSGVMSLPDALKIVAERGRIMDQCPQGAMLAVRLPEADLRTILPAGLDIAALNAPALTVVSGLTELIDAFAADLASNQISARKLLTSHAFHSRMMDGALAEFEKAFENIRLHAPSIPYVSNVTGQLITAAEATSPSYYVRQLRQPVRFADGVSRLLQLSPSALLEVGPGQALAPLAKQNVFASQATAIFSLLPPAREAGHGEYHEFMKSLGRLWLAGAKLDWDALHEGEARRKVSLPLYPFQRQRYCPDFVLPEGSRRVGETGLTVTLGAPIPTQTTPLPAIESQAVVDAPKPLSQRRLALAADLREQWAKLSGLPLTTEMDEACFFDLGFDSLFLTQVTLFLKRRYGAQLTFRQLAEQVNSIAKLAEYLDETLPEGAFGPATPAPTPTTEAKPTPTAETSETGLLSDKLASLQEQLAALRNDLLAPPASKPRGWRVKAAVFKSEMTERTPHGPFSRERVEIDRPLSTSQKAALEALVSAYVRKTTGSKNYTQQHRSHFADPRAVAGFHPLWKEAVYPLVVERSKGSRLWDVDGNDYIDLTLGFGPAMLGHSPDFVIEAISAQMKKGIEIGPTHPLAGEVAALVCEMTGLDRVAFCNTGSEAVMAALRVARTITGRDKVVTFSGDYHGTFDEVLMRAHCHDGELSATPIAPGIPSSAAENILVLPYGEAESLEIIRQHASEIAAVLVEPVRSRDPGLQPADFLRELRRITEAAGTALIFDEVVTGFRCHPRGAQGYFNIEADLATYGKVIGGGLPIGLLAGRKAFMDALDGGMWQFGDDSAPEVGVTFFAGTFVRHPLALAAAKAVLLHLKAEGPALQENLNRRTQTLVAALNGIAQPAGLPIQFAGFSSYFYPTFAPGFKYAELFFLNMRLRGVHVWQARPWFVSTAHSDADLEDVVAVFLESTRAMQEAGFFGGSPVLPPSQPLKFADVCAPAEEIATLLESSDLVAAAPEEDSPFKLVVSAGELQETVTETDDTLAAEPAEMLNESQLRTELEVDPVPTPSTSADEEIDLFKPVPFAPLLPGQQELFLGTQVGEESALTCHESLGIKLTGPVDSNKLREALQLLAVRHDCFRASFTEDGERMLFAAHAEVPLRLLDISNTPELEREGHLERIWNQQFVARFDLAKPPLFRAALVKLAEDEHCLILIAHHIVCDGWSFGVLYRELAWAYALACGGEVTPLEPAVQLSAFARQHARWRENGAFAADAQAWLKKFETLPPPFRLPTDRPATNQSGTETGLAKLVLGEELTAKLTAFCRDKKLTVNCVLLAVWQILLHRLSGSRDFIVGVPIAGQASHGVPSLCGHLVQFSPLRAQLDPSAKAENMLLQVKDAMLEALENQNFTLGQLLEHLPNLNAEDRQHFVPVTFGLEPLPEPLDYHGLQAEALPAHKRRAHFDLTLYVYQSAAHFTLVCSHRKDIISAECAQRWMGHFQTLLTGLLADPTMPVHALPLLNAAEREHILRGFNTCKLPAPPAKPVQQWFEEQVAARPDAVALEINNLRLSYHDLNVRANKLAHCLRQKGVERNMVVPVLLDRSVDFVVAVLGVLKAGGAYLPVDPAYPAERIELLLRDSGAKIAVTQHSHVSKLSTGCEHLVLGERFPDQWESSHQNPDCINQSSDLACVIYTSGSTGQPKGVSIPHRAITRLIHGTDYIQFDAAQTFLLASAVSFDASTFELWGPLCHGGKLAILPSADLSLEAIGAALQRHHVTTLWLTAGLFQLMVEERVHDLAGVRQLIAGGDVLSPPHVRKALASLPDTKIFNGYGPTENTTFSTCHRITPADLERPTLPIGRPIPHTEAYVLDENRQPVPLGVPGELYLGGEGLALGYWNRPILTERYFVPHPFSDEPGARLYRTGDLVRWLPGGVLEFLGRSDSQVKIRGYRIEPTEVEAQLGQHPAIQQACVMAHGQDAGNKRLVAYVVLRGEAQISNDDLKGFLSERLPHYMVPSLFMTLKSIPVTAHGKIDRAALPEPQDNGVDMSAAWLPPETETEIRLAEIWAEILGRDKIGSNSNFFNLGGTSLTGLKLFTRIQHEFSIALPLGTLFRAATLQKLARVIDSARDGAKGKVSPVSELQSGADLTPMFCIHGGDGGGLFYKGLLTKLGPDRPVLTIESPALFDATLPIQATPIEEVAEEYLQLMRRHRRKGPYIICGYSYGGVVAFELACMLQRLGEEVPLLVLFDTENPACEARRYSLAERLAVGWKARGSLSFAGKIASLGERIRSGLINRLRTETETAAAKRLLKEGLRADSDRLRGVQIRECNAEAMRNYKPSAVFHGPLLLFRSDEISDKFEYAADYGWRPHTDQLIVERVPGKHLEIFDEPHVSIMAERLKRRLVELEQPQGLLS